MNKKKNEQTQSSNNKYICYIIIQDAYSALSIDCSSQITT